MQKPHSKSLTNMKAKRLFTLLMLVVATISTSFAWSINTDISKANDGKGGATMALPNSTTMPIASTASSKYGEATTKETDVEDIRTYTINGVSFDMVKVEGGTFFMGTDNMLFSKDEKPKHQVTVSTYYIGQTEVTEALWKAVMLTNPSVWAYKGIDQLPVDNVSWDDCQEFIKRLNLLTGQNFRMPTEAEWEFAAIGGNKSHGYVYSGSNDINEVAWYDENSNHEPQPVATKAPNELGIYDMTGNADEWCSDWYARYSLEPQVDPTGASSGKYRIKRGGSYFFTSTELLVLVRSFSKPEEGSVLTTLRLCMSGE